MNSAQQQALKLLTNRVETYNRICGDKPMNGVVTWNLLDWSNGKDDGSVFVNGSNLNDEKKWFETHIQIIAEIGPRGGVKFRTCDGMSRKLLK